ncbi:hypothetical protein FACS1894120_6190 [Clostridia bacterium]|nr:hypothetical protein FACS1894120_6190 [Clostridia bacterium]
MGKLEWKERIDRFLELDHQFDKSRPPQLDGDPTPLFNFYDSLPDDINEAFEYDYDYNEIAASLQARV